jgi:hypothetical protein
MSHQKVLSKLIIAAVAVVFLLSGTAEAGSFTGSGKMAGFDLSSLLNQAWDWLENVWAGSTTAPPTETSPNSTPSCPPTGCPPDDSGYGIDPNGGG